MVPGQERSRRHAAEAAKRGATNNATAANLHVHDVKYAVKAEALSEKASNADTDTGKSGRAEAAKAQVRRVSIRSGHSRQLQRW